MRAIEPSASGTVVQGGVDIYYEVFGDGGSERTIVLGPVDPIVDGRVWKAQVAHLARRARVVVIDTRGNGRSGRPTDPAAYAHAEMAADVVAVLDELGVETAVLGGLCCGSWVATLVAAHHPDRVRGILAIGPWLPADLVPPHAHRTMFDPKDELDTDEGWAKDNSYYRLRDYAGFVEFFFGEMLPEPHSSKQQDDAVGWALQTSPEIINACAVRPTPTAAEADAVLDRVRCPVLVIYGEDDRCQPRTRAEYYARATAAEYLVIAGAGHLPNARQPVAVNLAISDWLERVWPVRRPARQLTPPLRRTRRALYLSSPIGLGHGRRDLAIAAELRALHPDLQIDWLAQPPLVDWLRRNGESVHPASALLTREADHIDAHAGEHDLNAFQAIRDMDEIMVGNFMVFAELAEREPYDLWVGDEAWELDYFLYENPELKRTAYAWLTDFVGWTPTRWSSEREHALIRDYNAEMLEQVDRLPRIRDRAIFVGNPDDVVDLPFGPDLPDIREWTSERYAFSGYVTGFDPAEVADRAALRAEFGFGDEPVCLVAVGGSGAGRHLLQRAVEAYPLLAELTPGIRMVVVTGPRIDPARVPRPAGVEVHAWLPDLHRRLAAADVALVQGGLTTTMELTAAGRPFVYVPLREHFEQNVHVRHRLSRYGSGTHVPWDEATPERLAAELSALVGTTPSYRPVETDGASRVAQLLAELI